MLFSCMFMIASEIFTSMGSMTDSMLKGPSSLSATSSIESNTKREIQAILGASPLKTDTRDNRLSTQILTTTMLFLTSTHLQEILCSVPRACNFTRHLQLPAPSHRLVHIKSHIEQDRTVTACHQAACNHLLPSEQALVTPSSPCSFNEGCLVSLVSQGCFQRHQPPPAGPEDKRHQRKRAQDDHHYHLALKESYRLCHARGSQGIAPSGIRQTIRTTVCTRPWKTLCTQDVFSMPLGQWRWKSPSANTEPLLLCQSTRPHQIHH